MYLNDSHHLLLTLDRSSSAYNSYKLGLLLLLELEDQITIISILFIAFLDNSG